jgi:hypothetical protein
MCNAVAIVYDKFDVGIVQRRFVDCLRVSIVIGSENVAYANGGGSLQNYGEDELYPYILSRDTFSQPIFKQPLGYHLNEVYTKSLIVQYLLNFRYVAVI